MKTEIASYTAMILELKSTGQPAEGADAFAFTIPAANSPLFDPYLAYQRTISSVLDTEPICPQPTDPQIAIYADEDTIANPLSDAEATTNHLMAIFNESTAETSFSVVDGQLVSQGLPVVPAEGSLTPATPFTPSPERAAWIDEIEWHAIQAAAGFDPLDDIRARLLGQPRNAEKLALSIWLHAAESLDEPPDEIRGLRAAFGLYGALPMLAVFFDEGYILIDGVYGTVSGPFDESQPYDPAPHLGNHAAYEPGSPATVLETESTCEAWPSEPRWRWRPPRDYEPKPAERVPCPTPEDPNRECSAPPDQWISPVPAPKWPEPFYPHRLPEDGYNRPPGDLFRPDELSPGVPWRRNPGTEGEPTDWKCKTAPGGLGPVDFCATYTKVCAPSGSPCVIRVIICVFSNLDGTPPNRDGTPPVPGHDYPTGPITLDPDGVNNPNRCYDRYLY